MSAESTNKKPCIKQGRKRNSYLLLRRYSVNAIVHRSTMFWSFGLVKN